MVGGVGGVGGVCYAWCAAFFRDGEESWAYLAGLAEMELMEDEGREYVLYNVLMS